MGIVWGPSQRPEIETGLSVTVIGTSKLMELMCVTEDGTEMKIDPFVGCAYELETEDDEEVNAMIGKTYMMDDYWFHEDTSCWLCHEFELLYVSKGSDNG